MESFGFKDFEQVRLKATQKIEVNNYTYQPGETIVLFDKIKMAGLNEVVQRITAHGGFDDRDLVFWDRTKALNLTFSQGVVNKTQLEILTNSKSYTLKNNQSLLITKRDQVELDTNKCAYLTHQPVQNTFAYLARNGQKVMIEVQETTQQGTKIYAPDCAAYEEIIVDYQYDYNGGSQILEVGRRLTEGYVSLEGITRLKDDVSGQVVTGIIYIPKLKLMSNLSMTLGSAAAPVMSQFRAEAVPVGSRENARVFDFIYLSDDIESDF